MNLFRKKVVTKRSNSVRNDAYADFPDTPEAKKFRKEMAFLHDRQAVKEAGLDHKEVCNRKMAAVKEYFG